MNFCKFHGIGISVCAIRRFIPGIEQPGLFPPLLQLISRPHSNMFDRKSSVPVSASSETLNTTIGKQCLW
jgi:hypothetical protein